MSLRGVLRTARLCLRYTCTEVQIASVAFKAMSNDRDKQLLLLPSLMDVVYMCLMDVVYMSGLGARERKTTQGRVPLQFSF